MREVPTGATPASFTAAQPPKCHAGKLTHCVACPFPWSHLTPVRLVLPPSVLNLCASCNVQMRMTSTQHMLASWMPPRPSCLTYRRRCAFTLRVRALCTVISMVTVVLKAAGGRVPALEVRSGRRGRAGQAVLVWRWAGAATAQPLWSALSQGVLRALFHYEQESSEQTPEQVAKPAAAPQLQEVDRSAVSLEARHCSREIRGKCHHACQVRLA